MYIDYKSTIFDKGMFLEGVKKNDKVFIVGIQRYTRNTKLECTVVSKGSKYITVGILNTHIRFNRSTGNQETDFTPSYAIYPSQATYEALVEEHKRFNVLISALSNLFVNKRRILTLEDLEVVSNSITNRLADKLEETN